MHDPEFVGAWLELIRQEEKAPNGSARGYRVEGPYRLPTAKGVVKVLSGEQSNSSVIVDDGESAAMVKFFRVLSDGTNPEIEVGAALTKAAPLKFRPPLAGFGASGWPNPATARAPNPSKVNWR